MDKYLVNGYLRLNNIPTDIQAIVKQYIGTINDSNSLYLSPLDLQWNNKELDIVCEDLSEILIKNAKSITQSSFEYAPKFNIRIPSQKVIITFVDHLEMTFSL